MAVTRRQFDAYARRNATIGANVKKAIDRIWDQLDKSSMEALVNDLAIYLPLVADKFGKVAAVAAAEFYDASRKASKARGSYTATTATGALWKVNRDVTYAVGEDFAGDVKAFLTQSVQGVVRDYGRETIRENSRQDRWASGYNSVPTSGNPCAMCVIKALGSYRKYDGEFLHEEITQDAWHLNCSCELIPVFEDSPHWVEGQYDEYYGQYDKAAKLVRSGDLPEDLQKRIDDAKEQHAKLVADGKSDKKWSSFNEITIAMRYQNEGMH